jgi:hypothetical protein
MLTTLAHSHFTSLLPRVSIEWSLSDMCFGSYDSDEMRVWYLGPASLVIEWLAF